MATLKQVCLLPLFAVLQAGWLLGADAVPTERRLPADVVGYFSVRNVEQIKQKWPETLLGQLSKEPELKDFWQELQGPLEEASEKIQEQLGMPLAELLEIPHGELAIAVTHSAGKPLGMVAFLDFGDKGDAVTALLEKGAKALEEEGAKRSEEEHEGTQIVIYTQTRAAEGDDEEEEEDEDEDAPAGAKTQTFCYFVKDSFLVIGSRPDTLKAVITRWDGQHERIFAEKAVYKYIVERCRGEEEGRVADFAFFVDPIGIVKAAVSAAGASTPQAGLALGFIPTLGLDRLKGIGGTFEIASGSFDSVTRALVYMEPPTEGVLKLFQFPTTPQAPPKWVSAQTSTYMALNWNVEEAYDATQSLYDTFAGEGSFEKFIDQLAGAEEGPKVHLKKDIIDQLTGTLHLVGDPPEGEELEAERYLFALDLKDEAPIKKTLAEITATEAFPGQVREFEGVTLYEMSAAEEDEDEEGVTPTPALAVVRKQLMIATDVKLLENMIRGDQDRESLADTAAYQKISRQFPAQTSSIGFQRADMQIKGFYEALRSGQAEDLLGETKVDLSKLPPFEVIRPYLTPSGNYMVPDEKGLFMMSFTLKERAEK